MRKPALVEQHEAAGRYLDVKGQKVFVREQGDGPTVLLLHGVPSSSFLYRKMLEPLASRGLRAVTFDFPGVGLSDKPKGAAYDWHALAEWVQEVVQAAELRDVHLVVHDIAGPIGTEWAIGHAERVRSITILNTLLDVGGFTPPFPMWTYRVPGLRHVAFDTMHPAAMLQLFRQSGVKHKESIDRDTMAAYIYLLKCNGGKHSFLEIMAGFNLTEAHTERLRKGLLALEVPMQLIWGEHEIAIPVHQLEYIKKTFPLRAQHMVDARHFLQEDQAEPVSRHIADFVLSLE